VRVLRTAHVKDLAARNDRRLISVTSLQSSLGYCGITAHIHSEIFYTLQILHISKINGITPFCNLLIQQTLDGDELSLSLSLSLCLL